MKKAEIKLVTCSYTIQIYWFCDSSEMKNSNAIVIQKHLANIPSFSWRKVNEIISYYIHTCSHIKTHCQIFKYFIQVSTGQTILVRPFYCTTKFFNMRKKIVFVASIITTDGGTLNFSWDIEREILNVQSHI